MGRSSAEAVGLVAATRSGSDNTHRRGRRGRHTLTRLVAWPVRPTGDHRACGGHSGVPAGSLLSRCWCRCGRAWTQPSPARIDTKLRGAPPRAFAAKARQGDLFVGGGRRRDPPPEARRRPPRDDEAAARRAQIVDAGEEGSARFSRNRASSRRCRLRGHRGRIGVFQGSSGGAVARNSRHQRARRPATLVAATDSSRPTSSRSSTATGGSDGALPAPSAFGTRGRATDDCLQARAAAAQPSGAHGVPPASFADWIRARGLEVLPLGDR